MNGGAAIRSFLVSLGFSVDGTGEKKMSDSMENVEKKAKLLNAAMIAMATATVLAVAKTAAEMEKLYYASQRIGASAENIRGFEAAVAQMGGSAAGALQSLESVARKIRESPGYEGMIKGLGVATRDQNGGIRDRVAMMGDLAKKLQGMEYHKANAYANSLGIDENTLMAMRDGKFNENVSKYAEIRKQMGLTDDLAESGKDFAVEARDITMTTKALMEVIIMTAGKALIPVLKMINQFLQAGIKWFNGLNPQVKEFLAAGLKVATLVIVFGGMFAILSKLALILPILKGLVFLIRALSLAFLMSPIGIVLALAAAIALLWEDYQVWKSGGDSLIDWGKWKPAIDLATNAIKGLIGLFGDLIAKAAEWARVNIAPHIPEPVKDLHEKVVDWVGENVVNRLFGDPHAAANAELARQDAEIASMRGGGNSMPLPRATATWDGMVETVNSALGVGGKALNPNLSIKGLTPENAAVINAVAKRIGSDPNDLAAVISFETAGTFSPSIKNPTSSATGLIQFMRGSGGTPNKYYGLDRDEFAALPFAEQMKYVERYFKERGFDESKQTNVADLYTAVTGWGYRKGSQAYELNKVWDSNKDGFINKGEMVRNSSFKAHQRNYFVDKPLPSDSGGLADIAEKLNQLPPPPVGNPFRDQTNRATTGGNATSRNVNISQKTDIHVTGVADPLQAAQATARQQEGVNYQLAQNAQSAIG